MRQSISKNEQLQNKNATIFFSTIATIESISFLGTSGFRHVILFAKSE
jgi:hypothetical protein